MLPRLLRRAGRPVVRLAALAPAARETLVLAIPQVPHSVETAVGAHLSGAGAVVHYVENTLINSLFGLLCWEAVFAAVPGAFFHPFQRGPADLHAPDFRARRAAGFETCLAELESGAYRDTIRRRYREKAGLQSPFVFWGALDDGLLAQALDCLPARHLRRWFERLLEDIPGNRSGLPDLIRFWPAERRYELIEVKGPGDRLQDNQMRWLDYCVAHGDAGARDRCRVGGCRCGCRNGAGRMSYTVAVRALCEFTAKRGDLDLRFTPAPSGAGRHRRPRHGHLAPRRRLRARDRAGRRAWRGGGARPRRRLRSGAEPPRGDQDLPRRPRPACRPTTARCTGRRRASTGICSARCATSRT